MCTNVFSYSHKREPTQANLTQYANPWKYISKPKNASKGKFARPGPRVKQLMTAMKEKKKPDTFFALLNALR